MKKYFLLLVASYAFSAFCQQSSQFIADSLQRQLLRSKKDSSRCKILNQLGEQYFQVDPIISLQYGHQSLQLAQEINWAPGIPVSNAIIGKACIQTGNYDSAIIFLTRAYQGYKKSGIKDKMAFQLGNIGVTQVTQKKYPAAQATFFEALAIAEELHLDGLKARVLSSISYVFDMQQNYDKALEYAQQSLKLLEKLNDSAAIADIYRRIGSVYGSKGDTTKADSYLKKALAIFEKEDYRIGIADVYQELSLLYKSNLLMNLKYRLKAEEIFNKDSLSNTMTIENTGQIGYLFFQLSSNDSLWSMLTGNKIISPGKAALLNKAGYYLNKAIQQSKENGHVLLQAELSQKYAELLAYKGNYKQAYHLKVFASAAQDSVFSQENKNKIAEAEGKYEIAKKNEEIAFKQLTINNQQNKMWLLAGSIGFLIILGAVFLNQNLIRKKTNTALLQLNTELKEANKIKTTFFGIITHDLRSPITNLINFLTLQKRHPGLLSNEQIADRENKITESAKSLLETMESMLLWSKGQMEHFKPVITTVPVNNLFSYLQKFFSETEHVFFQFSNPHSLTVNTDEDYLKTIMHNLTANAVKAVQLTPDAKIEWKAWAENGKTYFSITDNGVGINEDKLSALYEETIANGSRQGLGLHIIRDLAKAIGCVVKFEPDNKVGTTFILSV